MDVDLVHLASFHLQFELVILDVLVASGFELDAYDVNPGSSACMHACVCGRQH